MNPSYRDTYRQHRVLYLLPLLVGLVMALWINVGAEKLYRSSTSLWSDTAGGSASDLTGAPPPATQEQTTLNELLRTQYFVKQVARTGPLEDYLKHHPSQGFGPGVLLGSLRGSPSLDARIAAALSPKRVTSLVLGPHVLQINYDGPTPTVSYETLRALITVFQNQQVALHTDAIASYQQAIAETSKTLAGVRSNIATYIREHPGASRTDPEMQQLIHAERNALSQLSAATVGLNQAANSTLGNSDMTLKVIDQPEVPTKAYSRHKKMLMAVFAGLFVGALISWIVIYAKTKRRRAGAVEKTPPPGTKRSAVPEAVRRDAARNGKSATPRTRPATVADGSRRVVEAERIERSG